MYEEHHKFDPLRRVLERIRGLLSVKNEIRGDSIFCPHWDSTITPQIEQCEDRYAVVGFYMSSDGFDEPMYECCASAGKDADSALCLCVESFILAFMDGFSQMKGGEDAVELKSEFAGALQEWELYKSGVVGMGETVGDDGGDICSVYWDMLKEELTRRLGCRNMCFVKIFASKAVGKQDEQTLGEVRINDVVNSELSRIVREYAEKWNVRQFASQKQFFFIRHKGRVSAPYSGAKGRKILRDKVKRALELYAAVDGDDALGALLPSLYNEFNDPTLAQECFSFMPEMCAENAFPEAAYPERMMINVGERSFFCFKSELSDYYPIAGAMFDVFSKNELNAKTNDVYRLLISLSGTFKAIDAHKRNGGELKELSVETLSFNMNSDFELR